MLQKSKKICQNIYILILSHFFSSVCTHISIIYSENFMYTYFMDLQETEWIDIVDGDGIADS